MTLLSENIAVSFGGLTEDSVPVDWCAQFDAANGWKEWVMPAGVLPPRSAGHSVVYNSDTSKLVVSFGLAAGPTLLDDQWILDFGEGVSGIWRCVEGTSPQCQAVRSKNGVSTEIRPARPSARAFAAGARVGLYQFLFGGLTGQPKQCAPGLTKKVLVGSDELWAMNVAYNIWFKVQPAGSTPWARAFSQLASLNASGGYTNPTLLIGGANTSCELDDPPCSVWQPLNDVWLIDTAQAKTSETDKECQFDGLDDVITVHLPYWCSNVFSLGTLWLDMWAQPQMTGNNLKSILFDAYNDITPVLRWFLEFRDDKLYAVLTLNPGDGEVAVKRWGPIDRAIGFWRHYCFTLRFARFYSSTDENTPSASIAQAFFFIDGEAVNEEISGSFLEIDLKQTLTMDQGLTALYVGGPNPAVEALGYRNFKGSADNIRVWWPACPHETDPSVCNPFAFLYPKLMDGRRQPSSGIPDSEVKMTHVARPVLDAMFSIKIADSETNGLIVAVGFDGTNLVDHGEKMLQTGQNTVDNDVNQTLVQVQHGHMSLGYEVFSEWPASATLLTCKGCNRQCSFLLCEKFDIDCITRGLEEGIEWRIRTIAETGTCICRDYKSFCPENLGCIKPTSSVLSVNVTAGGRGYKSAPQVSFKVEGGKGRGAQATAKIDKNGTVISVTVSQPGTGYEPPGPTVVFSGGGLNCSSCSSCCASAIVGLQLEGLQAATPEEVGPSEGGDGTTGDEGGSSGGTGGSSGGTGGSSGGTSTPDEYSYDGQSGNMDSGDSCEFANNGVCDEPEWCDPGTDTTDCQQVCEATWPMTITTMSKTCCPWSNNGYCDEPDYCYPGTDKGDCDFRSDGYSDWISCSSGNPCPAGGFCNFDYGENGGSCEPCSGCPDCFQCGLPEAGAQACNATCTGQTLGGTSTCSVAPGYQGNNWCWKARDDYCSEPGTCYTGSDTTDCCDGDSGEVVQQFTDADRNNDGCIDGDDFFSSPVSVRSGRAILRFRPVARVAALSSDDLSKDCRYNTLTAEGYYGSACFKNGETDYSCCGRETDQTTCAAGLTRRNNSETCYGYSYNSDSYSNDYYQGRQTCCVKSCSAKQISQADWDAYVATLPAFRDVDSGNTSADGCINASEFSASVLNVASAKWKGICIILYSLVYSHLIS